MYSSRGTNAYGQQTYGGQSGYAQNLGAGYSGSSVGGPDGGAQMSLASRHSSILGSSQEADVGGYRALPSVSAHYGGQYSSIYGTAALSATQQVPAISSKGAGPSALEARSAYASAMPDSPKFASTDYVSSSSHSYSHKGDQLYAEKIPDYPTVERRQYGERQGGYLGRDLPSESSGRYADSAIYGHQHQPEIYDRLDQAVLLRQEQLLKAQSAPHEGGSRQADYLAARSAASRHSTQDLMPYGGRIDADPRSLSLLSSSSSYGGQPPSILGAAPKRNVDDLMYPPNSANPGYGVSLPPGRDYGTKGLHVASLESEYPSSTLSRSGHPRIDERKDDRAGYLREFEMRVEERHREHLREREKDRERERMRERERLRERERERERLRILERREKERERERKRTLEVTRERTPPRVSRDHRGPSLTKEARPLRRDSPRREASHRRLSPVKEKRREYVCKVYSSTLVDVERDYLSIDKRYPRLFVPPEFSKAVLNWPKENLKLSMHTPVSFEHDFVEEGCLAESEEISSKLLPVEPEKSEQGSTVWNAKMILMSGLSRSALEELSSEKIPDDRILHICNILRFAVLKKDHSFMAIGGPWVSADGSNPTDDESSLIRTALRYGKDVANLDLQNCQHWNRFLEIHYDRVGKDGLFSHKEVTVLFVPDLSECLPSFDTWQAQWLAHRKAVCERERQLSLKKEKSKERKEGLKDKETDSAKQTERGKPEKRIQSVSSSHGVVANKKEKRGNSIEGDAAEGTVSGGENKVEVKDGSETAVGGGPEKKEQEEAAGAKTGAVKSVKKKIIKRIVKQKVANKTAAEVNTASKQSDKVDEDVGEQDAKSQIASQKEESFADRAGVKTFVRKKIAKKEAVGKTDQSEDNGVPLEAKVERETGCSEDQPKDNSDASGAAAVQNASVKTTVKKKIIKRVPKRKVPATQANNEVAETKEDDDKDEKEVAQAGSCTSNIGKQAGSEKQGNAATSSKSEIKAEKENKDEKVTNVECLNDKQKVITKDNYDDKRGKLKEAEKSKDEKEDKDSKDESRSNPNRESKEKRKSEEPPPRHPGLILQTNWSKDSKLRSLSLSLDSLLDYTDKDIEESTFELSLFAEALYEMLQYQMGCRILTFLQKLRVRFMTKRNQRKRQREETHEKGTDKKSPTKRLNTNELSVKNESTKSDTSSAAQQALQEDEVIVTKEETTSDYVDEPQTKDEIDDEDPEEYEAMDDASPQSNSSKEKNEEEKTDTDAKPQEEAEKDEAREFIKEEMTTKAASTGPGPEGDTSAKRELKVDPRNKELAVDKDLLQAFRFFDRNRIGYIRVEDMRLIIHSLGKFLSHRDVKELVQSALLESNTGRDDHILYNKLVRISDI
ncbi:PREDICTED: cell division cycle and apoptosis regulator protein 1 [Theobroma cacao]|uniref:Cell division cycle and apoptosis regulator protein 1 n=1 Tax=Theobroma cacao TaxID=3641 RepID=A0AB32VKR6_THECC|nr:PREDICTED: cell division cycle and apoptosis regulator protein 1 [Theobroma cacao]